MPANNQGFLGINVEESKEGLKLTRIEANSPAAKAGLKVGDVVKKAADAAVTLRSDFAGVMKRS